MDYMVIAILRNNKEYKNETFSFESISELSDFLMDNDYTLISKEEM